MLAITSKNCAPSTKKAHLHPNAQKVFIRLPPEENETLATMGSLCARAAAPGSTLKSTRPTVAASSRPAVSPVSVSRCSTASRSRRRPHTDATPGSSSRRPQGRPGRRFSTLSPPTPAGGEPRPAWQPQFLCPNPVYGWPLHLLVGQGHSSSRHVRPSPGFDSRTPPTGAGGVGRTPPPSKQWHGPSDRFLAWQEAPGRKKFAPPPKRPKVPFLGLCLGKLCPTPHWAQQGDPPLPGPALAGSPGSRNTRQAGR